MGVGGIKSYPNVLPPTPLFKGRAVSFRFANQETIAEVEKTEKGKEKGIASPFNLSP